MNNDHAANARRPSILDNAFSYENSASHSDPKAFAKRMEAYRQQAKRERELAGADRICDLDSRRRA